MGIDPNKPGDGGIECANFLSVERRIYETLVAICLSSYMLYWGYKHASIPEKYVYIRRDRGGKRLLLLLLSLCWGIEIGFKFASKTVIYLLNPCHITTAIQIYLLAAKPSIWVTILFRIHLNFLNGAILALLFPVTNTREHVMMLIVPYYLLRLGGVYVVEPINNFGWTIFTTGIMLLYHFLILQAVGMLTLVNLNSMLCPAISDPFYGSAYRIWAILHQSLMIPVVCKGYTIISQFFLTKFNLTKIKTNLNMDVNLSAYETSLSEFLEDGNIFEDIDVYNKGPCHRRSYSEVCLVGTHYYKKWNLSSPHRACCW